MRLRKYSAIKSNHKIVGNNRIRKEYKLIDLPSTMTEPVYKEMLFYIWQMRRARIPVPRVYDHSVNGKKIVFLCEYQGLNLTQQKFGMDLVERVLDILDRVKQANIYFDPHIKNFVVNNFGRLYYVDFSPPYTPKYQKLKLDRTKIADKELVRRNFEAFAPHSIAHHFVADIMRDGLMSLDMLLQVYNKIIEKKFTTDDYDTFMKRAVEIMEIEQERMKRGVYLI